ncbi:uncharacterized protein M421DRAFT_337532 [Didymella exigua CBS 183.55]|uniref:RING-type domain-containing protein n=1 Tax=Didymella exigua CBS 183.55 TaxID=1150837 RepID=A0A6A5RAH8_9PLEO|nr:uncharacterized protein M421DRAFT_337532 [Didymella exigua CBS 183.55]KAF1922817.1 hypothetical protein M421DRAFT_337532 [Didymella exigua CBS 183.55]
MFYRLLTALRGRRLQAYQVSQWRRVNMSNPITEDRHAIQQACNCLFKAMENAIDFFHPRDAGAFFSVVQKCVELLVVWIGFELDELGVGEFNVFSRRLKDYIRLRFPNASICTPALRELITLVKNTLHRAQDRNPEYATVMAQVSQRDWTEEHGNRLFLVHLEIVNGINHALFQGLLPNLRSDYSFVEMVTFTRGHRRESWNLDDDFPMLRDDLVELEVDETEREYGVIGERIELSAFCGPVTSLPRGMECSICVTEFDGKEVEGDLPVSTKCRHFFHGDCLDKWVNESAMKSSNTCPTCRTVLCKPRKRVHESLEPMPGVDDEDDTSSVTNSSAIASVIAVPLWPRLQRLNARIANHLSRRNARSADEEWSDTDDSSMSSSDSVEAVVPQRVQR